MLFTRSRGIKRTEVSANTSLGTTGKENSKVNVCLAERSGMEITLSSVESISKILFLAGTLTISSSNIPLAPPETDSIPGDISTRTDWLVFGIFKIGAEKYRVDAEESKLIVCSPRSSSGEVAATLKRFKTLFLFMG